MFREKSIAFTFMEMILYKKFINQEDTSSVGTGLKLKA